MPPDRPLALFLLTVIPQHPCVCNDVLDTCITVVGGGCQVPPDTPGWQHWPHWWLPEMGFWEATSEGPQNQSFGAGTHLRRVQRKIPKFEMPVACRLLLDVVFPVRAYGQYALKYKTR